MKIWIDLTNSPHVNFFANMIKELQADHEVLITCRPLANTVDMLEMKGFKYHVVGKHYGANKFKKTLGFIVRVIQLCFFLRKLKIDVTISHSSFQSAVVARLMGIRSIYLNDNEHATANRLSFICANTIMIPEFLSIDKVRRQWGNPKKVIQYPGVKEGVYLSKLIMTHKVKKMTNKKDVPEIFIRPEPWAAQYYSGRKNFMDDLIINLKKKYRVVLLPRDALQADHYRQDKFSGITIPDEVIELEDIAERCSVFIGAGGTMTRELAVLGIPTISVYEDRLLEVDKYLIKMERMIHKPDLYVDFVVKFMETNQRISPSNDLLVKGQKAYDLIKKTLLKSTN